MRGFISAAVVLVVTLHGTCAQSVFQLCAGCKMENGAGYNHHPTDCAKFVHCHFDANGVLYGEVQNCSFSTYWNTDLLTCSPAEEVSCPNDKCIGQPDGTTFAGVGNCRGFWECRGGKSNAKCCAQGENWNETIGACVENIFEDGCLDTCYNDFVNKTEVTCDKQAVAGRRDWYEQYVPGLFWVPMPCAPGTEYVPAKCGCDLIVKPAIQVKRKCTKELYLPFDVDHLDRSGKGHYVENQNVEVVDGVARFNGVNSRLIIPRFTNLEHSSSVVIWVNYTSDHVTSPEEHAIVSNSDCGNVPSILIAEDAFNTYYGVGTSMLRGQFISTAVPQTELAINETVSEKALEFKFDGGFLTGSNGVDSRTVQAPGVLRNVQCGLHIGDADDRLWFKGEVNEISVYLCNPYEQ